MKHTKKLLALLLAAILALGISAPAMAEEELLEAQSIGVTQDDIIITNHQIVSYREPFSLSVEASPPEGVEIVSYQWWFRREYSAPQEQIEGATNPTIHAAYGDPYYLEPTKISGVVPRFSCVVTFAAKDAQGNVTDTAAIRSQESNVLMQPLWSFPDILYTRDVTARQGESFTLRVDVNAPEGVEVSYRWGKSGGTTIEDETGPELHVAYGGPNYPKALYPYWIAKEYYSCHITLVEKDAQGNTVDKRAEYVSITVTMDSPERRKNIWDFIWHDLIVGSFSGVLAFLTISAFFTGWPLFLFAPIAWIIGLFKQFFPSLN